MSLIRIIADLENSQLRRQLFKVCDSLTNILLDIQIKKIDISNMIVLREV